jgi:cephalosporin hydroxylase
MGGGGMIDLETTPYSLLQVRADVLAVQAEHKATIDAFHKLWYSQKFTWGFTYFEGVSLLKNPLDLWIYQEIIFDLKPTLIIETGTAMGGSALYFARQLDRLGAGNVISVDLERHQSAPTHPRITYLTGSSVDAEVVASIRACAATHPRVMVTLDSDHGAAHVLRELDAYAPMVTPGQFIVVEDTNITGHPLEISWKGGPGPYEAVDSFLSLHPEFERDVMAERYLLSMHPGGWLRRVR